MCSLGPAPKALPVLPFWTAWDWFLDSILMANLPFSFPFPWKGSARWSAPNVPVPGSLSPPPCAPGGGWLQCHLAMAQPGEPGLPDMPPHGCVWLQGRLGMQVWALPGSLGTRVGMFRYSCQGCAPACQHTVVGRAPMSHPTAKVLPGSQSPTCSALLTSQETSSAEIHFALSPAKSFFYFSLVQTAQKHQAAGLPRTPKEAPGPPQESPPPLSPPSFC